MRINSAQGDQSALATFVTCVTAGTFPLTLITCCIPSKLGTHIGAVPVKTKNLLIHETADLWIVAHSTEWSGAAFSVVPPSPPVLPIILASWPSRLNVSSSIPSLSTKARLWFNSHVALLQPAPISWTVLLNCPYKELRHSIQPQTQSQGFAWEEALTNQAAKLRPRLLKEMDHHSKAHPGWKHSSVCGHELGHALQGHHLLEVKLSLVDHGQHEARIQHAQEEAGQHDQRLQGSLWAVLCASAGQEQHAVKHPTAAAKFASQHLAGTQGSNCSFCCVRLIVVAWARSSLRASLCSQLVQQPMIWQLSSCTGHATRQTCVSLFAGRITSMIQHGSTMLHAWNSCSSACGFRTGVLTLFALQVPSDDTNTVCETPQWLSSGHATCHQEESSKPMQDLLPCFAMQISCSSHP